MFQGNFPPLLPAIPGHFNYVLYYHSDASILHFARMNNPNQTPFSAPKLHLAWTQSCPNPPRTTDPTKIWRPPGRGGNVTQEQWHMRPAEQPSIIKQHSYSSHLLTLAGFYCSHYKDRYYFWIDSLDGLISTLL